MNQSIELNGQQITARATSLRCIQHPEWGTFGVTDIRETYLEIRGTRGSRILGIDEAERFWEVA